MSVFEHHSLGPDSISLMSPRTESRMFVKIRRFWSRRFGALIAKHVNTSSQQPDPLTLPLRF